MIPKIIHYCWFGHGKKPKLAEKCIASWKKHCPDYRIIEWNEDNFDINMNPYTKMCYEQKKYAFLTDYVRLLVVSQHGGIYFDTDVEVLRPFDDLLKNSAFFGFENEEYVNTGVGFGAKAGNTIVIQMLKEYDALLDGKKETIPCPTLNTRALELFGLQKNGKQQCIQGAMIYPEAYFNPYDSPTGRLKKTSETYSIHWYAGSWISRRKKIRAMFGKPLHRIFGTDFMERISKKNEG